MVDRILFNAILLVALPFCISLADDNREGESVNWQVVSAGAETSQSGGYFLSGTVGQVAVGVVNSPDHGTMQGFYQDFGVFFVCDCIPGEINDDDYINVLDILALISYKYKDGPPPTPYEMCNGDANCDCAVNVIDIMYLVDYKFRLGVPPCECTDWVSSCGPPIVK